MTRFDSLEDAIRIFKDDPLEHAAGTDTLYSSYAFNLLAGVVETVSGSSLEDYLTRGGLPAHRLDGDVTGIPRADCTETGPEATRIGAVRYATSATSISVSNGSAVE